MSNTYEITTEQDSIVIRLPKQAADEEVLMKLLDYLELEAVRRRSRLTKEDAKSLAKEIKQGAWQQVRHLFEK
jgi:hypothetical protein